MTMNFARTRIRGWLIPGFATAALVGIGLSIYQGSGPGAWPVKGALYEVCPENYPKHSLREITADIPRLKKLGITAIYLTPIFSCLGNAQYLINDYDAINPRYGTEEDLKDLVAIAHQHGIKVLLDLVTSLTYDGTKIMREHPDWVLRGKDGQRQRYFPIPEFGWALDCMNPEVIAYFSGVARRYVERFDIDGWRVDSPINNYDPAKVDGDHSRTQLLRAVRKAVDVEGVSQTAPHPVRDDRDGSWRPGCTLRAGGRLDSPS